MKKENNEKAWLDSQVIQAQEAYSRACAIAEDEFKEFKKFFEKEFTVNETEEAIESLKFHFDLMLGQKKYLEDAWIASEKYYQ